LAVANFNNPMLPVRALHDIYGIKSIPQPAHALAHDGRNFAGRGVRYPIKHEVAALRIWEEIFNLPDTKTAFDLSTEELHVGDKSRYLIRLGNSGATGSLQRLNVIFDEELRPAK
jgi:hypothetical protein